MNTTSTNLLSVIKTLISLCCIVLYINPATADLPYTNPNAPVINVYAPSFGTIVEQGDTLLLSASAYDAVDGSLSHLINWSSNKEGFIGVGSSWSIVLNTLGEQYIDIRVTDREGNIATAYILVIVVEKNIPDLQIFVPAPMSYFSTEDTVDLLAVANQDENDPLNNHIQWHSHIDGFLGTGSRLKINLTPGVHQVSAEVMEADGDRNKKYITIHVNQPTIRHGCKKFRGGKSTAGDSWGQITLINRWDRDIDIYYIHYDGTLIPYRYNLAPNDYYRNNAYQGHLWVMLESSTGNCVSLVESEPHLTHTVFE